MHQLARQRGAVQIIMMLLLALGLAVLLAGSFNSSALQIQHAQDATHVLLRAREALIGDAIAQMPVASAGYLRLPDLGFKVGNLPSEGSAAPNFTGNGKDYSAIGKLPWRTLGLDPLRDNNNECLWYAVSGRFKNTPVTDTLNWDTEGQIDLSDASGNLIAANLAAVIIAPGAIVDGQDRTLANAAYVQCGGNYDAQNYLDTHSPPDAASGILNYFPGSTNNRVDLSSGNKLMLMANTSHYNDRFIAVTPDDIFNRLSKRADFATQITQLLNDAYFSTAAISGSKGTGSINCNLLASGNREFCKNWKEMLLLTQLPVPAPVSIDGSASANCTRVLLFGGKKNASQFRHTAADKANPINYLEAANLAAFSTPIAHANNFSGASTFNSSTPDADLLKCLP